MLYKSLAEIQTAVVEEHVLLMYHKGSKTTPWKYAFTWKNPALCISTGIEIQFKLMKLVQVLKKKELTVQKDSYQRIIIIISLGLHQ